MVERKVSARLPHSAGTFDIILFRDPSDGKEHLALIRGTPETNQPVLTRIHSECFTGDTLHSERCDCHDQLDLAMQLIGREEAGVLLYLRQEGRGIGLENKLKAYRLQDEGFDTVDANLELGRADDERSYEVAAAMLRQIGIHSIRLLTNSPRKIEGLRQAGIQVTERVPLRSHVTTENFQYLETKRNKLHHLIDTSSQISGTPDALDPKVVLERFRAMHQAMVYQREPDRPVVTTSFAQSLDGSIALTPGESYAISSRESLQVTHGLRAMHDAILIGIGTLLADDPRLTVRFEDGRDPRPVIVDSSLRIPEESKIFTAHTRPPLLATTEFADKQKIHAFEQLGAEILQVKATPDGKVDLRELLRALARRNLTSVMVEGGSQILTSFFVQTLVDVLVITLAPFLLGGVRGIGPFTGLERDQLPVIHELQHMPVGEDLIIWGKVR